MADIIPIPFGPWEPDRAPHMSPALVEATNVLPVAGAYAPFPSLVPRQGGILPDRAQGLFTVSTPEGPPLIYAATKDKIFAIEDAGIDERHDAGSIAQAPWRFTQFAGRTIAVNPAVYPLGAEAGDDFTALDGDPPKAHVCGVVGNFLVLGNLIDDDIDGDRPSRIRWSGFENPDSWGTNAGTQADFQDMNAAGGPVIAITGRELGTVFQRKAISRMQYAGPPLVFNFELVEAGRGAISTGSVCDIGGLIFFIADDGFFVWNGTSAVPIGTDRIDRWFNDRADYNRRDEILSGYDPIRRCVLWGIPEHGTVGIETLLAYSIAEQRWTTIHHPIQQIGASQSLASSVETMPIPDDYAGSFDDPAFAGQAPVLAGIDGDNRFGSFSGPNLPATLTTGDYQVAPGRRSLITGVRPIIDSSTVTIAVGDRDQSSADAVRWKSATTPNRAGTCPQRNDGRYVRYRLRTPAGDQWSRAVGIEVELQASGGR